MSGRNQQQQQLQNAKNNQGKKQDLRDASKATRVVLTSSVRDALADKDAQTAQLASAAFLCVNLVSTFFVRFCCLIVERFFPVRRRLLPAPLRCCSMRRCLHLSAHCAQLCVCFQLRQVKQNNLSFLLF